MTVAIPVIMETVILYQNMIKLSSGSRDPSMNASIQAPKNPNNMINPRYGANSRTIANARVIISHNQFKADHNQLKKSRKLPGRSPAIQLTKLFHESIRCCQI